MQISGSVIHLPPGADYRRMPPPALRSTPPRTARTPRSRRALMKRLLSLLLLLPIAAPAADLIKPKEPIKDRYIVVLDAKSVLGLKLPVVDDLARQLATLAGGRVLRSYAGILGGFALEAKADALAPLLKD